VRTPAPIRVIATVILVLTAGSSAGAMAAPAQVPGARHAMARAAQEVYWKWSDGSQKTSRTFKQSRYHDQAGLPVLVVSALPASPKRTVYLQFKQKGAWVVEKKGTTNGKGVVRLDLYPYCSNDTWCDGIYEYRLKAGTHYQNFRITYSEK
jgi:hypothetical protein